MRFETSNTTPPHLNRRLQLRMLGFVGMIGVIMFVMSTFQAGQQNKLTKNQQLPGSPDDPIFQVQDDPDRVLKPDEFLSPPADGESGTDWKEPPPMDQAPVENTDGLDAELARREVQFDKGMLRRIKDNTIGIRHEESDPYFRLLYHASRVPAKELEQAGATDVLYINLMTQPDQFRGEPITIYGDLWRLYEFEAGPNAYGLKHLYEAWIFTADSTNHPYRVVFTHLPRDLEPGENLRKPVRVTGYFFKREGYASTAGMHVAPTLLAQRVVSFRPPNAAPSTDAIVPYMFIVISAVGLAFLVTLVSFAISDRRAAREAKLRDLNAPTPSFAGIDGGSAPSITESLRLLEEQEWQAEADATNESYPVVAAALHARDRIASPPRTAPAPVATDDELAERRRLGARAVQAWTNQNATRGDIRRPAPVVESDDKTTELTDDDLVESADENSVTEIPSPASGLSKLAAWENEIQQLSANNNGNEAKLTEEQRLARAEVDRDRRSRHEQMNDRLQHQRVELEREQEEREQREREAALRAEAEQDLRDEHEQPDSSHDRLTIDRADRIDRRETGEADQADDDEDDSGSSGRGFDKSFRRRRRRDGR